ncbi:MAG: flagellar biosynthesis protein FlhA [Kiritimatiellae bacterium]|nr:flagellar biosynthesis protein FlhA [Kiritimatiellia bacterium]
MAASERKVRQSDLVIAVALMVILGVLLIPVPTQLLDILLVFSISAGVLVLILTVQIERPLELSAFPSLLLMLTLFRLALNVATTRQILLQAYAGKVIQAFGDFVVGGNYVIGIVIFLILVLINFIVITKGSARIAEVAARFTLDAMPGKQMSIDADLNAGLIDEKTALTRRRDLSREADFYGAMDGASRFVRGDAIAGLIITAINIGAGFAVGMWQQDLSAVESLRTYTILTIGDGLVAQIPALVISTAAGMLVTRAAEETELGTAVANQLFVRPKPLMITGGVLAAIACVPGLPFVPFMALGSAIGGFGYALRRRQPAAAEKAGGRAVGPGGARPAEGELGQGPDRPALPSSPAALKHVLSVSPMDLEIGFGLVPLVDRAQNGKLVDRIGMVRSQIAEDIGVVMPPVNVRDNVNLRNNEYSIKIRGLEVARNSVRPGSLLAISPGGDVVLEGGIPVHEPAFGFEAFWIPEERREAAEAQGLTVVDCASVITTHLAEVVKRNAADILSRQSVSDLIDQVKESNAAVVQELIPNKMPVGSVHRVLQGLLRERVSIRDLPVILETLADQADRTQDTAILVEYCRRALSGHICRHYLGPDAALYAIGISPQLEEMMRQAIHREGQELGQLALDPALARGLLDSIRAALDATKREDVQTVLLCSPLVRAQLRQLTWHDFRDVPVLSFAEVAEDVRVNMVSMIPAPRTGAQPTDQVE